jgi:hypothetical protein
VRHFVNLPILTLAGFAYLETLQESDLFKYLPVWQAKLAPWFGKSQSWFGATCSMETYLTVDIGSESTSFVEPRLILWPKTEFNVLSERSALEPFMNFELPGLTSAI